MQKCSLPRRILQNIQPCLEESSVAGCVVHCLTRPGVAAVIVSYSPGVFGILGDQFNCICARQEAVMETVLEDPGLCGVACPGRGELRCGDTEQDVLSVYMLHPDTELCHHTDDSLQGCLSAQAVQWEKVVTLHDFNGLTVQDCHERCSLEKGPGLSISRSIFTSYHISYSVPFHGTRFLSGVFRQIHEIVAA